MEFNGYNWMIEEEGNVVEFELQYDYKFFFGVEVISWIFVDMIGKVIWIQVIVEVQGGGLSIISNDVDL